MEKLPLSLVIITLNEESNIKRCIESVPFAAEVIVVDSLSTDKTREIAESLGARVMTREFRGYRDQKQFAIEQATQTWILSLDADEALSPELQKEIPAAIASGEFDGFRAPRVSFHLGRWIRHGGWYPDFQTRLFKKGKAHWVGGSVHESAQLLGYLGTLKGEILHFVFKDLSDQIDTNNEFSSLGAKQLATKGEAFGVLKLVFRPFGKFLETYVWKLGFLDGVPGFIISLGAAQSLFLKYAKLWEKGLAEEHQNPEENLRENHATPNHPHSP